MENVTAFLLAFWAALSGFVTGSWAALSTFVSSGIAWAGGLFGGDEQQG